MSSQSTVNSSVSAVAPQADLSDIEVMRERLLEQELELGKLRAEVRETYRELARLRDTELVMPPIDWTLNLLN